MALLKRSYGPLILFATLFIARGTFAAPSSSESFGLGVIFGSPTALTLKSYLQSDRALDFGFGYSWNHSVVLYSDYLFEFKHAFHSSNKTVNEWAPYVGVGALVGFYDSGHKAVINNNSTSAVFAMRIPLGIDWRIPKSPVELFLELVPLIDLIPGLDGDFEGGVGVRVFF